MCALSTAISSAAAPGRIATPSFSSAATMPRSTCSWSNVTTRQRSARACRSAETKGEPISDLGGHPAGGVVGPFGQDRHGEPERAGRLARHSRQLARPDEPDVVRAQVARPRRGFA